MTYGTWLAYGVSSPKQEHFGGPLVKFPFTDTLVYIALIALLVNLIVVIALSPILRALGIAEGEDETRPSDYTADAGDPGVVDELDPEGSTAH